MIRPTEPRDTPGLVEVSRTTGVFKPLEIVALREVLDDYHAKESAHGHRCISCERHGELAGFAYFAPSAMADRVWYLYWIAVKKTLHAQGIGAALLKDTEDAIRAAGGRLYLIETSSLSHYEATRKFYLRHGYTVTSILTDFYADGDDLVVFAKRLLPKGPAAI
jgi:ribosomal protein S18 acetylase RimI-like enzyme